MDFESEANPQKKPKTKPKVVKEWVEDDVFKLISFVEEEPCLWNAKDESYHNKVLRDTAWQNICENFGTKYVPGDLNAKWTNLRIQYRSYAGRAKTKSGQGTVETPKWRFYQAMSFVGRAEDQQTEKTDSNIFFDTDAENISLDHAITLTPILTPPPTKRRRIQAETTESASTQIAETMKEAVAVLKERSQNVMDPNTSFANYLLSELKTLNDDVAASVRKKVTLFFLQCLEDERSLV